MNETDLKAIEERLVKGGVVHPAIIRQLIGIARKHLICGVAPAVNQATDEDVRAYQRMWGNP